MNTGWQIRPSTYVRLCFDYIRDYSRQVETLASPEE